MYKIIITALSRVASTSGVCRGAVSTANALALLNNVSKIYLIIGEWQVDYYTKHLVLKSDKIKIISIDIKNNSLSRNIWTLYNLPKLAYKVKANWVLLAYPMPILKALFPYNTKLLVIVHDLYPFSNPENFGYPNVIGNQLFTRMCIANVHQIVFISNQTKKLFYNYFPNVKKPSEVIHWHSDINPNKFKRPESILEKEHFMLMIAQHRKNKNIPVLIETYESLMKERLISPQTKLIIVGSEGPETPIIKRIISSKLIGESVKLLSSLKDEEIAYLYKYCQLIVCPSTDEGFGYTIIESVSFEKPIVCSDISIFREIGGENCIYFSLNEPVKKHLSDAIVKALKRPRIKVMDRKQLSLEQMVKTYNNILQMQNY